jgi:hypothetical protein
VWQDLLSKSGSTQEFINAQRNHQERLDRIKTEIMSIPLVGNNLNFIASADPQRILHCLAMEVIRIVDPESLRAGTQLRPLWMEGLKRKKEHLESVAQSMMETADTLESVYGDLKTYPDSWRIALQAPDEVPALAPSERVPRSLIKELRDRAHELQKFVSEYGDFLKKGTPVLSREWVVMLLLDVHARTTDVRRYLPKLAKMLRAVYERFGIKKRVSAGSLKKVFDRYIEDKTPS